MATADQRSAEPSLADLARRTLGVSGGRVDAAVTVLADRRLDDRALLRCTLRRSVLDAIDLGDAARAQAP